MSMPKFMLMSMAVVQHTQALRAVSTKDKCQCLSSNGAYNEWLCEGGDRPTIESCLQDLDDTCHWGPLEVPECEREVQEYFERPCHCMPNGIENESLCLLDERPTIGACLIDDKCHWGPSEHPKCKHEVNDFFYKESCHCFAKGAENKLACEGGARPTVDLCIQDDKCFWGPDLNAKCYNEVQDLLH